MLLNGSQYSGEGSKCANRPRERPCSLQPTYNLKKKEASPQLMDKKRAWQRDVWGADQGRVPFSLVFLTFFSVLAGALA